jgi:lipopolysaccharide biosynthesis glycosyltransferase
MSKTAVVTMAIGAESNQILTLTRPSIEAYAKRIGAAFEVISTRTSLSENRHVAFEKAQIEQMLRHTYSRVFYVDADVLIMPHCPNLFEIVPETHIGASFESDYRDCSENIVDAQKALGDIGWTGGYFNTGVTVLSSRHRGMYYLPATTYEQWYEQSQFNFNAQMFGFQMHHLPLTFNYQCGTVTKAKSYKEREGLTPDKRFQTNIIHYAGIPHGRLDRIREDVTGQRAEEIVI